MLFTISTFPPVLVLVVGLSASVQDAPAQVEKGGAGDLADNEQRQQARRRMLERWSEMRALVPAGDTEQEVDRLEEPVFTYSEPTRETGDLGTLWVWGTSGRPAAVLSQSKANERPVWGFELVALSEGVSVVMHDGWRWSPKSALKMTPFADAPLPAGSAVRRLSQMKDLAEQFSVSEEYGGETFELRLLSRPVYRYQDAEGGLTDGALFVFAHGTNPEALAVIECREGPSGAVWSYGFLPLAGAAVAAELDGTTVWSKEPTRESRAQDVYSTWLETE